MKSSVRFFILILACLSSAFAGQFPTRNLVIYSDPQISYPELYEVSAKVAENRFQITFLLSNGHSIQREKAGILAMVSYPPEVISPDMELGTTSALQQIDPLIQKYPKFTRELEALRTKWQNALAAAKQMKAAQPKPTPDAETFSFTTRGEKFENVKITNIGVDSFSVTTDSGVAKIAFTDLPENLDGIPDAVKTVVINKRNEAIRIAQEAEEKNRAETERLVKEAEEKKRIETERIAKEEAEKKRAEAESAAQKAEHDTGNETGKIPEAASKTLVKKGSFIVTDISGSEESRPLVSPSNYPSQQALSKLTFESVFNKFMTFRNRTAAADIQGFRFGSTIEDVQKNYVKQYGEPLKNEPEHPSDSITILKAWFPSTRKEWHTGPVSADEWHMVFVFFQGKLVYISKTYENALAWQPLMNLLMNYFEIKDKKEFSDDSDNCLVETKNYIGLVSNIHIDGSGVELSLPGFQIFDKSYFTNYAQRLFPKPFEKFKEVFVKADFSNFNDNDYVVFKEDVFDKGLDLSKGFPLKTDPYGCSSDYGAAYGIRKCFFAFLLQNVFPSKTGLVDVLVTKGYSNMSVDYRWDTSDDFHIFIDHNRGVFVGRNPQVPKAPSKL